MDRARGRQRDIILVFGKTGMGKTRWTRAYLRSRHRVLICDPIDEYDGAKFSDMVDLIGHVMRYQSYRCRTEWIEEVPMLASVAMESGDCTLVIEEAQRSLPNHRSDLPSSIQDVIYRGRHPGVTLILVSQRASTVHIAARSQWTRLITFRQTEIADCKWIEEVSGERLDLPALDVSEYYDITPTGIIIGHLDKIKIREIIQEHRQSPIGGDGETEDEEERK